MPFWTIIYNPIAISTFFSLVIAQTIKVIFDYRCDGKIHWQSFFRGAGMPSSHTSTVVALSLSVYLTEGLTNLFIVTAVFSAIVVRDVIGDKAFAVHQENIINRIVQQITHHQKVEWNHLIGHTLTEVFMGIILAIVVTLSVFYLF